MEPRAFGKKMLLKNGTFHSNQTMYYVHIFAHIKHQAPFKSNKALFHNFIDILRIFAEQRLEFVRRSQSSGSR